MRGLVPPDPETNVSEVRYAVVYRPRQDRKRFAAGCVEVVESREAALRDADPGAHRYAAQVLGPSKSSEGQFIYYLVQWLV
ncbi:MAG: hypothetical protein B7Z66_11080 [Chromatiales bacterium 21-64-14]|nr:MAG: hypothetical protein B7Z66_11080 [Chromatiales bacterium 21-64-14]HQU16771.1 hypothetical protein [Gammaproteobacteria bacterium]